MKKNKHSNSCSSQRARILKHLQKKATVTTIEARNSLGILHPAGRIKELRELGYDIRTLWTRQHDNNGVTHRIGLYLLNNQTRM